MSKIWISGDRFTADDANRFEQATSRPSPKQTDPVSGVTSHATGGDVNPFMITASRPAAWACIQQGNAGLDIDLRYDASRKLWCCHDGAAMTDLGLALNGLPSHVVSTLRLDPTKLTGGSYPPEPIMSFGDLLDTFGGIIPISTEPKDQSTQGQWSQAIPAWVQEVNSRGLQDYVTCSCSANNLDWKIQTMKDAGVKCWAVYLTGDQTNDDSLYDLITSAGGCVRVSLSNTVDDAHLAKWKAAVPNVAGFGGMRRSDATTNLTYWQGRGVTKYSSQRAGYWAGTSPHLTRTLWDYGRWAEGDLPDDGLTTRQTLLSTGLRFDQFNNGTYSVMMPGDLAPLPAACTMDVMATYEQAATSGNATLELAVCAPDDTNWGGAAAINAYLCTMGSGGNHTISTRDPNYTVRNQVSGGGFPAAGTKFGMRISVDATSVNLQPLDATGTPTADAPATYADTRWRGGYVHIKVGGGSKSDARLQVHSVNVTAS